MGGIQNLAPDFCRSFNQEITDDPDVYYQSVMSTMKKSNSTGFPLNITWHLVKKYDKEANDGLVTCSSALWGHYLGEIAAPGKRGISHGDIVDMMREDIPGFDVREFYIDMIKNLKQRGF